MRSATARGDARTTVGVDLVEIRGIERLLARPGAAEKLLTVGERAYCEARGNRPAHAAARLAAKEAVMKAFGTGLRDGIRLTDVEVVNDGSGRPLVELHGAAAAYAAHRGLVSIDLSLSHTSELAIAQCVVVWRRRVMNHTMVGIDVSHAVTSDSHLYRLASRMLRKGSRS